MAKSEPGLITIEMPSSALSPGTSSVAAPVSALTRGSRSLTKEEEYIGNKLRTDLAIQIGTAIKAEHAAHLSQILTQRSVIRFDEYVAFDREIMDRHRANADDQADVVAFCTAMRRSQANTLLAVRQGGVNKLEETVMTPLDPPQEREEVIIEQRPGLLGKLLLGQTVTTVKR